MPESIVAAARKRIVVTNAPGHHLGVPDQVAAEIVHGTHCDPLKAH